MEREVDNSIRGAVTGDIHPVTITVGNTVDVSMSYRDRCSIEQFSKGPGRRYSNASETGGNGIPQMPFNRFIFAYLNDEQRILTHGDDGGCIVIHTEIQHLHRNWGLSVEILHPLDELCLIPIGGSQIQPLCDLQHRCLRTEDDDLVVDSIHRNRDPAIRDVFKGRHAALQSVTGN